MKQVTIDTVRERIAELEMVHGHGELSLCGEFELACLRQLADSMGGVDDDVRNVVALLENNEWAEHCTKTELGQRLECEITRLVGSVQPVTVENDAEPSFNAMMRALDAFYVDDSVPEIAMLAAFRILLTDVRNQGHQEPAADNTAQQFEALATSGKSEHLLNAERIAREAKALSDRLNATSAVDDDMICYGERCKVCDEMIIGCSSDGLCVSCRDESTSAGSGKP